MLSRPRPSAGLLGLLTAACLCIPTARAATGLPAPLVVTQVPPAKHAKTSPATSLPRPGAFNGSRLVVVSPDGQTRVLSAGFESACDPNVSFDGQRVLFSGRREPGSPWRIWDIGLDGQGLRAVSPEGLEACSPIHVSTLFTLDSPEPWFTTVFVGREPTLNEAGLPAATSLYNIRLDGTELRRLTYNPNLNLDPFQTWDGRILYAAQRAPHLPGHPPTSIRLHAVHMEGADPELFGGEKAKRFLRMPCATDRGLILFVESDQPTADGSGQLACVEERRPHATYRALTTDPAWRYLHPQPLTNGQILAARSPSPGKGTYGIVRLDPASGQIQPVFDTPEYDETQAVTVTPRPRPDGHSTVVDPKLKSGLLYGLNCYDADALLAPHLAAGMVKRVRIIEGVPQGADGKAGLPSNSPGRATLPQRLVGEAPVEADGSFNVEVPADVPLRIQSLDEDGLALATCGWVWVKPKEKRGCIGCHEDPERIPENDYVLALRRPSNQLVLPPEARRTVSFRQDVAPILQQHCATADCHGGKRTDLRLPLANAPLTDKALAQAYANLLAPASPKAAKASATPTAGRFVDAGRARTSRLIWHVTGTCTARPWDVMAKPASASVTPMPPPGKGQPLSPEQRRTLIQWIDLGAAFDAPPTAKPATTLANP